ncbi:hypothetical protein ACEQ8H_000238 [Pleosporales sp. CAS-2024a]
MSMFDEQFQYFQQQPLYYGQPTFAFDHHAAGPKTPTDSLLNHTGLSPAPLTATPPLSRTSSRPPELPRDQPVPDQILWDDGSLSNSPTSVRTPDGESFEVEMLDTDLRTFYQTGQQNGSTQVFQNAIPAVDTNFYFNPPATITNQALQTALQQTMQAQQFTSPYHAQAQHVDHFQSPALHMDGFASNYTAQPMQHEPWNGQAPPRSSMVPRTGGVIFDPATDPHPVNYAGYQNSNDVALWTRHFTDPTQLSSPSEQRAPHQEPFFNMAEQNLGRQPLPHRPQINIPTPRMPNPRPPEPQWFPSEPAPDQQGFVNYDASSTLFTDCYITNQDPPPSSPGNSSMNQFPHSPYPLMLSPSAVSPGGSDGVFSFHSDSAMMLDPYPVHQQFLQLPSATPMITNADYLPAQSGADVAFDNVLEPEPSPSALKNLAKNGGRALGTHLEPEVAKAAHDMRKISACWHCVLQRDKCSDGKICARCLKRSQRPNADCGLGCTRIKLVELSPYFLPPLVTQMHEDSSLKRFVNAHVQGWGNVEITLYMTCGGYNMPRIPVKVYEFIPNGTQLSIQLQYVVDPQTNQRISIKKRSPPLGMVHINHNEEKTYDKYINDIVDHHLDAFGELFWIEDDNDFLQKLFKLMTRVKPKNDDEAKLLREVFRLLVVTFIMSHALTIAEEGKHKTLSRMHSYAGPSAYAERFISPRMANRQLKYFFNRLQRQIQALVLNKLQQIFKSSKGCDKWLAAFVAVLGMCMALEDEQKHIHLVMWTRVSTEGGDAREAQDQAAAACREIDTRMLFVQQIFRWKYNRKHNPLVNTEHDWEKEVGFGDRTSVEFVRQVAQLVRENTFRMRTKRVILPGW